MDATEKPYVWRIWMLPREKGADSVKSSDSYVAPPTLVESVVAELRRMMLAGELNPGERLVEERLTEHLGVSRPPVREALRVLQRDGVVTYLPRRGVAVAPLAPQDVREIYSLRWALERLSVDLSLPLESDQQLVPLQQALDEMRLAALAGDGAHVTEANWQFHLALCSMPGHKRLVDSYQSLTMQLQICMAMNLRLREKLYGNSLESVARHEELLDAIRSGDRDRVHRELDHHGDLTFLENLDGLMGVKP